MRSTLHMVTFEISDKCFIYFSALSELGKCHVLLGTGLRSLWVELAGSNIFSLLDVLDSQKLHKFISGKIVLDFPFLYYMPSCHG